MPEKQQISPSTLRDAIVEGMQERNGKDIVSLHVGEVSGASAEYFVICHGQSDRQVGAIAKSVEEYVFRKYGVWPSHREGYENQEWVLLDYFDVVAHILIEPKRAFFAIEELWADAETETFVVQSPQNH